MLPLLTLTSGVMLPGAPPVSVAAPLVPAASFADSTIATPLAAWLTALRAEEPRRAPVAKWRMLVLLYPFLDTEHVSPAGVRSLRRSRTEPELLATVQAGVAELPALVRRISGGACDLEIDTHTVDRAIRLHLDAAATFASPSTTEIAKELERWNLPVRYDSVAVLFHSGDVRQAVAASGGGGPEGTRFSATIGDADRWAKKPGRSGGSMSWGQGLMLREWSHGLESFFGEKGYLVKTVHGLNRYRRIPLADGDFFVAYHQGLLSHLGHGRYGYGRSVWAAGTPRRPVALLPCQPISPAPGAVLSTKGIDLRWAATAAPDGYVVTLTPPTGKPIELRTGATHLVLPPERLVPGKYRWHVQAVRGADRSAVADAPEFTVAAPAALVPPTVTALALDRTLVPGEGGTVRLWARLKSPAGIRIAFADYRQADGNSERVRLQPRSEWPLDDRWTAVLRIAPNREPKAKELALTVSAEDLAGKTVATEPVSLTVGRPTTLSRVTAVASRPGEDLDAIKDGVTPADSADRHVARWTWAGRSGTTEWVELRYAEDRIVDAAQVYWFRDAPHGECDVPESWRLLYREDDRSEWKPVPTGSPPGVEIDRWNLVLFGPIKAKRFRIEAKLRSGFSAGILEWQLLNLNAPAPARIPEPLVRADTDMSIHGIEQHWRDSGGEIYSPFPEFDFLQVRVHFPTGPLAETARYDDRTWAEIRWSDGEVRHVALEGAGLADGSARTRTPFDRFSLYGVATAWIARSPKGARDYEVRIHYRHPDGTLSVSPPYRRVFLPDVLRIPPPAGTVTASHCFANDSVDAVVDGLLPPDSAGDGVPRFTWYDHRGGEEWIQVVYPKARTVSSAHAYWFSDAPDGGCRVPESWVLLFRNDDKSPWQSVAGPTGYRTALDEWNSVRFTPVTARQFRLKVTLQESYSAGLLEWRLF